MTHLPLSLTMKNYKIPALPKALNYETPGKQFLRRNWFLLGMKMINSSHTHKMSSWYPSRFLLMPDHFPFGVLPSTLKHGYLETLPMLNLTPFP